jgi:hypothetical protein
MNDINAPSQEQLAELMKIHAQAIIDYQAKLAAKPDEPEPFSAFISNAIFPKIVSGSQIETHKMTLPTEIISGILSRGEKGELAGGSKSFKTWALIHQSLAIAAGIDWWNFSTQATNVIFLNLEIPQPFFEARVRTVAHALEIQVPRNFYVWHLRRSKLGDALRWNSFLTSLTENCRDISNPYITSDPIYKLLGGRNENAAGDVQLLLEQLDDMIESVDGANFFGHHFSKGNQANKDAIDRASGSGVFQRDPDTIFTMTPHEKESAFVVDAILRNHPPIDPFVVEWQYPLFVHNPVLDTASLKMPKKTASKYDVHMIGYWLGNKRLSTTQLYKLLHGETGMSNGRFYELLKEAEALRLVKRDMNDPKFWLKTTPNVTAISPL